MRKIFLLICIKMLLLTIAHSQNITPSQTLEQCPGVDITFTVSIAAQSIHAVHPKPLSTVVGLPFNISPSGDNITFSFIGRFGDNNSEQGFTVHYINLNGVLTAWDVTYTKIKSLLTANPFSQIYPSPTSITAPSCQTNSYNISFPNVQYGNIWENPAIGYGTVTNYEYQLPNGWSLGGATSNGSNWIAGGNSVTITSDLSTGDGGAIKIRPVNTTCAAGLVPGQQTIVTISRPSTSLSISGSSNLCSGSNTYTVSGVPAGATVTWTANNPNAGTITPAGNSCTVTKMGNGILTLTVTAIVDGTCTAGTTTKTIRIGYNYINASVLGETTVYPNAGYSHMLLTNPYDLTISNIVWRVPSGWTIVNGQGTSFINVWTGTSGGAVQVDFKDACGIQTGKYLTVGVGSGGRVPQIVTNEKSTDTNMLHLSMPDKMSVNQKFIEGIRVYPNPAKDNVNFVVPKEFVNGTLTIIDGTGKTIKKVLLKSSISNINISRLSRGLYTAQLVNDNTIQSLKFIKK